MRQWEWHPGAWDIFAGFYPRVWGFGIHFDVGPSEVEFRASLGPFGMNLEVRR
jgi:hypothetical protein